MEFHFRRATMLDLERLLQWRNDSFTRQNSINTEPVQRETHERWLKASLENRKRKLYIAEISGEPVGTVRLDQQESGWELSWTVAPAARGKGIGKRMVKEATNLITGNLTARVKDGNLASVRIAEYAGFHPVSRSGELVIFCLKR